MIYIHNRHYHPCVLGGACLVQICHAALDRLCAAPGYSHTHPLPAYIYKHGVMSCCQLTMSSDCVHAKTQTPSCRQGTHTRWSDSLGVTRAARGRQRRRALTRCDEARGAHKAQSGYGGQRRQPIAWGRKTVCTAEVVDKGVRALLTARAFISESRKRWPEQVAWQNHAKWH
jgi:hypothetical protein